MTRPFLLTALILSLCSAVVSGQKSKDKPAANDNYDAVVAEYLATARAQAKAGPADANNWMNSLNGDRRATNVNDLVTVRVMESISAIGTADSNLNKKTGGSGSVTNLVGAEKYIPSFVNPTSLIGFGSDSNFKGGGSTNRASELSAVMTARVAEVLPNGDLVLEGIREVEINGDRQIIVLTGVARAQDVGPGNVLLSPSIGQLRIRYFGKGLIKDTLTPGFLIRILNKIF
jgi:flagellar L-ring protein precursor FlgH